jgi:hypothetical protein
MRSQQRLQHVALNVAKFVSMRFDPVLAADVAGSDVIRIDGMGIVWGARALKPYLLGPGLLQQAARRGACCAAIRRSSAGGASALHPARSVPRRPLSLQLRKRTERSQRWCFVPSSEVEFVRHPAAAANAASRLDIRVNQGDLRNF